METIFTVLFCSVAAAGPQSAGAESDDNGSPTPEASARLTAMSDAADRYDIARRGEEESLTLAKQPILRYSDNVTKVPDGALFLWTRDDRPAAVVCIWYHPNGTRYHEFQPLSEAPLVARADGVVRWNPKEAGVEYSPMPDAAPPASEDRRRLSQMRSIARRFSAAVSDPKYGRQELRLLPQPLYRYGDSDGQVLDGGLFAFAKGTNPEVLLLVEARRDDAGHFRWHYAPARMSSRVCKLMSEGRTVWELAQTRRQSPEESYFNRTLR